MTYEEQGRNVTPYVAADPENGIEEQRLFMKQSPSNAPGQPLAPALFIKVLTSP